ncbi:MAG: cbb3-type cytochrome c oxidase subunit II [Verrucomicrobiaceae bacterium]|nr:cbb3-type cytochrome c oxidase subunit II [Verrucomicrobiaceae bacterium]
MSDFRKLVFRIGFLFAIPWLLLIVVPVIRYQHVGPVAYDKDKDGMDGFYPPAPIHRQGQLVYAREGCVQCHTQMIRAANLGLDAWRKGWGQDQGERAADPVRSNTLRDYLGEPVAFLGIQRAGPDLANAGWRFADRNKLHLMLYAPRALTTWSTMPSFKHLYVVQKAQGQKSSKALDLPAKYAPAKGFEVVPSAEAEALVDYILSLKKDYPVPGLAAAKK